MLLTEEQYEKVLNNINENWKSGCEKCGSFDVSIDKNLYELREFREGEYNIGGQVLIAPVVGVVCVNCRNINLLSTKFLGF